jgi:hypothetical protein
MNRCWTKGWDEKEFRKFIHPLAVAIVPTSPGLLEGQDAYVAGLKAFIETARLHTWIEKDHRVHVYASGRSAVVTFLFQLTFVIMGSVQTLSGRDMFFLVKEARKWMAAAEQFSPEPPVS